MYIPEDGNLKMRTKFEEYIQLLISAQVSLSFEH